MKGEITKIINVVITCCQLSLNIYSSICKQSIDTFLQQFLSLCVHKYHVITMKVLKHQITRDN